MKNRVIMKYMYLLLLCLLLLSCENSDRKYVKSVLKEWEHKEVLFPENMRFTILGEKAVDYSIENSRYKIVTYVDSLGCTSCKLNLPQWSKFIHQVDSLSSQSAKFVFCFFPKKSRDIYSVLRTDRFSYPICIDEFDSLNKLNHFPLDIRFQTFLLDKDNKVVAIGNPVHNPKVKELYLDIISGKQIGAKKQELLTKVDVSSTQLDFGGFNWKKNQAGIFSLHNAGKHPLVVQDITTSCGCTSVEYSKEPVASGKSLDIKVVYKADHPEHFEKTITVYCNAASSPLQFKVTGEAK